MTTPSNAGNAIGGALVGLFALGVAARIIKRLDRRRPRRFKAHRSKRPILHQFRKRR